MLKNIGFGYSPELIQNFQEIYQVKTGLGEINSIDISSEDRAVLLCENKEFISIFHPKTNQLNRIMFFPYKPTFAIFASKDKEKEDNDLIWVAAKNSNTIFLYSISKNLTSQTLIGHKGEILKIKSDYLKKYLLSIDATNLVILWSNSSNIKLAEINDCTSAAIDIKGEIIATTNLLQKSDSSCNQEIHFYKIKELNNEKNIFWKKCLTNQMNFIDISISSDGNSLFCLCKNHFYVLNTNNLLLYDYNSQDLPSTVNHKKENNLIANTFSKISPNVEIKDIEKNAKNNRNINFNEENPFYIDNNKDVSFLSFDITPDCKYAVIGKSTGEITFIDLQNNHNIISKRVFDIPIYCLKFSWKYLNLFIGLKMLKIYGHPDLIDLVENKLNGHDIIDLTK